MITTVIRGGLGNQLFQYASAYSLSKRLNQPLTLDISFFPKQTLRGYKLDSLKLKNHLLSNGEKDGLLKSAYKNKNINGLIRRSPFKTLPVKNGKYLIDHAGSFTPEFFRIQAENIFLNGYFQSEEYFSEAREYLLDQFQPNYEAEQEFKDILCDVVNENTVAVHVRHGDFAKFDGSSYHFILDIKYYELAIAKIRERVNNPVFFCFSDDIEWVKQNIVGTEDFHFVSLRSSHADIDELMLMKKCNHIITANSTFSWWAAWLNEHDDAIRIVPDKAYGNDHMIPDGWIKVSVE